MKRLIEGKACAYTVTCTYKKIHSVPSSVSRFTAAVKARLGAELTQASYDENGALRALWAANGWRVATFHENGVMSELFGKDGYRLAKYNEQGVLSETVDVSHRRGKTVAKYHEDGTVTLCDAQGKPLADCDRSGAIVAIRHPASDLLTEEDVEFEERRALAEARLPLARELLKTENDTHAAAMAMRARALADREAGREIAVVSMEDLPLAEQTYEDLPLTGYEVAFAGETLRVRAHAELMLQRAFAALLETMTEGEEDWSLPEDFRMAAVDARIATELPRFQAKEALLKGVYYCGEENYKICVEGATLAEYETYVSELKKHGFATYTENQIGDCLFGTYTIADEKAGEAVAFTMHYPSLRRTQIVYGPRGYLPSVAPAKLPEHPVRTTLTQPARARVWCGVVSSGVPGMCLVIQLADGRYIMIDGGTRDGKVVTREKKKGVWVDQPEVDSHDTEDIYRFLCEHAPNGEKPRIAVWFMTHPHMDHTDLAIDFLEQYQGKVEIELAAFNMPDFDSVYSRNENPARHHFLFAPFRQKITELYGAEVCILHAGQKMLLPGCELDVLYTQEDYYPGVFTTGNQLSCALRLKFADKTVLLLGDCDHPICQIIADAYGTALKSDIVQVAHHGANGACLDVYRYSDPEDCIWAIDRYRLENDPRMTGREDGYLFNRYLRDQSIRKRTHHTADVTVTLEV